MHIAQAHRMSQASASLSNSTGDTMKTATLANGSQTPVRKLLRDQRGAGLVEYAMLAGLVAIAAFGAFKTFGGSISKAATDQSTTIGTIPTK
jgi:pilus assembly protein Flp/PilA